MGRMAEPVPERGRLRLLGERPALDLVNTAEWRGAEALRDWLADYGDLLAWATAAGVLGAAEARRLAAAARARPAASEAALERVKALRAALRRTFGGTPDLGPLNAALAAAPARRELVEAAGGFAWRTRADLSLDLPLWRLAWSAADLLASPDFARLGVCEAEDCGWLFLDFSRGRSRRWCEMETCGNRAKARRHYRRARAAQG